MEVKTLYKYDGLIHREIEFKGKKCIIISKENPEDINGKIVFKTEYFAAFPQLQNEMLKRGYTLIFIENRNRWGTSEQIDDQYEFVKYVAAELGLSKKIITIGMSCGGMMSILLAAKHPEIIDCLYLDAPVVNFLSCPGRMGDGIDVTDGMWTEFEKAWGMTKSQLLLFREHPLDKIDHLVKNKVKIYMAYGDADKTVPYHENGIAIEEAYRINGLENYIYIDKKEGVDHHPHGPSDIDKAIHFIEAK